MLDEVNSGRNHERQNGAGPGPVNPLEMMVEELRARASLLHRRGEKMFPRPLCSECNRIVSEAEGAES